MRPRSHMIAGCVLVTCLIPRPWTRACWAQTQAIASVPAPAAARADALHEKAVALHAVPNRAYEAAQLHLQAAELRASEDPQAIEDLAMAAHMLGYAKRPLDAKRTMERAAERALMLGDVVRAGQALVDATFMANAQKNRPEINRLGRKALLLARSPLLSTDQKRAITGRLLEYPEIAAVLQ